MATFETQIHVNGLPTERVIESLSKALWQYRHVVLIFSPEFVVNAYLSKSDDNTWGYSFYVPGYPACIKSGIGSKGDARSAACTAIAEYLS